MNKMTRILLAAVAASMGGAMQALAGTGSASATVVFAMGRICADGSSIDGRVSLGYAPTESRNAVVAINNEVLLTASGAGSWMWYAPAAGTYAVSHTVGEDVMSAAYVVTNGYAKAEETPTVSDLKVTPVEPLGLAIDFNVSGASDAGLDNAPPLAVWMSVDGTSYLAKTLVGATNCVDGAHRVYWNMAKDGISLDPATAYLTVTYGYQHPLYCVIDLSGGSEANFYPVAYMDAPPSGGFNTTEYKTTKLVLKRVDSGSFIMGYDPTNESHRVTLTKPFYMCLHEVTQRQWELVTGSNPCSSTSYGKGDAHPVNCVSYNDIRGPSDGAMWPESNAVDSSSFLGKLRDRAKLDFDLPTEAQWEYTCRAGTTTKYSYGDSADDAYMWYSSNSSDSAHEVGTKLPNRWGFYDMHGNVWEWCLDWRGTLSYGVDPEGSSSGSYRVARGGSWGSYAGNCASSYWYYNGVYPWSSANKYLGFRLSRTLAEAEAATVEFAFGRICADGSSVDGMVSLGYAPTESRNAVVAINDEVLLNAGEAGSWTWYAPAAGTYAVSHAVGEDAMSAAYVVPNGYARVEYETLTVSDLKVTPVEPLGLAIDFNVSGASDTGLDNVPSLAVWMSVNGTNYLAKTLVGATNCVDGAHRVYWNMAKDGIAFDPATARLTVTYVYQYPYPLYCVIDLSGGSETNFYPVAYMDAPPSWGFNTIEYKTTKLVLKRVDAGSFIMGDDQADESHRVTLTKPFYMGLHEVTQRQWELVTGSNPCSSTSYGKGDAHPVHNVSYNDIRGLSDGAMWPESNAVDSSSFLGKLRKKTGNLLFDLPTEAQWEYACRAGTTTTYSYGDSADDAYMWCRSNSSDSAHEVGTKLPNRWGLYDMHGNVLEWCLDWRETLSYGVDPKGSSSDSARGIRGGCWLYDADDCTSSCRIAAFMSGSSYFFGFRLSMTLAATEVATAEFALGRICADGSSVDGMVSLGYAPTEGRNAVVAINDEVLLNAGEAGIWTWYAPAAGTYAVSHAVGEDVMSAAYAVTNGYAKAEEAPNPPMEVVEEISLSPSDGITVAANGKKQIIKISGNGEAWTGATSADWLKLNSMSGTATGKGIVCTITENVAAEARVGYVYVAGHPLKVSQAGRGATVDTRVTANTAGGEIAVAVSVSDETTTWSASSECLWIQVETQSGTGSGEVKLRVPPWNKAMSRTGTVTIAGQPVVVTQTALETVTTGAAVAAQGKTLTVDVEMVASTEWTVADVPGWIALVGAASRRGSDIVTLIVSPNTTFEDRSATIMIAGKAFTVTQDAAKVEIDGGLVRCYNASGCDSLVVTVNVDVETAPWTAEISEEARDSWVFLMSGEEPVMGDGAFELYIAPATDGDVLPRTATVAVGNATLRITQDDGVVIEGGNAPFIIPATWFAKYPALGGTTLAEWQKIAEGAGVKTDANGAAQPVWHDYVAGTDPTDATSRFTASVALEDGKPVVTWTPALNGDGVRDGERIYRVWGKSDLGDAAWSEVAPGGEAGYRFFRVTVEMP